MGRRRSNKKNGGGEDEFGGGGKGGGSTRRNFIFKQKKKQMELARDMKEVNEIEARIKNEAPPRGTNPLAEDFAKREEKESSSSQVYTAIRKFDELPIGRRTLAALKENRFTHMTDIQRAAIPHALAGRDVLGAARTGSGKTLAFVIPVLECLYRKGWNQYDGLGALIISPTRELAVQIFDVLRVVGSKQDLSAGLVIGGKDLEQEQQFIQGMNIMVATPGRLLQHMDQTYGFNCDNLQILVLDEADCILEMGFEKAISDIVRNIPGQHQTLLFSATQTKSVKSLAKLSLHQPEYISVHEKADFVTPDSLSQHYMEVPAQFKFDVLYSFMKTHLKSKIIVFVNTCKQVRFLFEIFRRIHPGIPLMAVHGKLKQAKRMAIYYEFLKKPAALLFATDLAARGLDFPEVDWVVQMDCAESADQYIHRVGRTARYKSGGHALLLLQPSELKMVEVLRTRKVPLKRVKVNTEKLQPISNRFQSFLSEDADLKYLAQRAFISYIRSIHLMTNKEVFQLDELPTAELAEAMGLPGTPRIKILGKSAKGKKNMSYALQNLMTEKKKSKGEEEGLEDDSMGDSKYKKLLRRENKAMAEREKLVVHSDDDDDDDVMVVKKDTHAHQKILASEGPMWTKEELKSMSRKQRAEARKAMKDDAEKNENDMGVEQESESESESEDSSEDEEEEEEEEDMEELVEMNKSLSKQEVDQSKKEHYQRVAKKLEEEEETDKMMEKKRLKEKRLGEKLKMRSKAKDNPPMAMATLGGYEEASGSEEESGSDQDSGEEEEEEENQETEEKMAEESGSSDDDEEEDSFEDDIDSDSDSSSEDEDDIAKRAPATGKGQKRKSQVELSKEESLALRVLKKNKRK